MSAHIGEVERGRAALLAELEQALHGGRTIPDDVWVRLRAAWPDDELARILQARSVDPLRWPESLHARPSAVPQPGTGPAVVLAVASIGVFMAFLDDTVVTIAFPDVERSFPGSTLSSLSWVLNAYNIAFAALMVPAGRLADRFGRRRAYSAGIVLFSLGSALAALAPSLEALVAARALQGVGAAVVVPASLALVLHATPPGRRAQAVAAWTATAALAAGLGPSVGGALVNLDGWRLVFLINLPAGLAAWWLTRRLLTESRAPGRRERSDLAGALLIALSIGTLVLAIVQGPEWGWSSGRVVLAAGCALVCGLLTARHLTRSPSAASDRQLLRVPGLPVTSLLTFVGAAGFFALGLTNVLFLIVVWDYTALQAGLATTPAPFLAAAAAVAAGWLAARMDARPLVVVGALVWAAGPLVLLRLMTTEPDFLGAYLPASAVLAVGVGFAFPLVSDAAVALAPHGRYAGAAALNGTLRQLGAAIGIAIITVMVGDLASLDSIDGFQAAWWFTAGCFVVVAIGGALLPPLPEPDLGDDLDLADRRAALRGLLPQPRVSTEPPPTPLAPETSGEDSTHALLREVSLFAELPASAWARLAGQCRTVHLAAGEWLFRQGDAADALYVVRSGRLEVVQELGETGDHDRLDELRRGSVVGELALLSRAPRSASVRVRRDAELLRVDRSHFAALMTERAEYGAAVARVLAEQLQRSRPVEPPSSSGAVTIVVVHGTGDARCRAFETQLLAALSPLRRVARLGQESVDRGDDAGLALARALDRAEQGHDLVVLSASGAPDDPWTASCLHQADRILLVLADDVSTWRSPGTVELLHGCDVALLGRPSSPPVAALLELLDPRSTQRMRSAADVARLARRLAGSSVGLVLSGGGARAFAHIGVLEELGAAGIEVDRIGGTSMGAFIAALSAQGRDPDEIAAVCHLEFVRHNPFGDYRLPFTSLSRGARARALRERHLGGLIEDLPLPYYCVSTDLISAELVVHRRGELVPAVGASMAVPGIWPPVVLDQRLLVDGAVLDCLPVATMAADHEGPIIASDVTEAEQRALAPGEPVPEIGLLDTLTRVMMLSTTDTEALGRRHADVYIAPDHEFVGQLEFHMLDRVRAAGRRATITALEQAPAEVLRRLRSGAWR